MPVAAQLTVAIVLCVGLLVGLVVGVRALLRGLRRWGRAQALALCPAAVLVDDGALFFGRQSIGAVQLRGNGCLALGADELVFVQWVTRRVLRIARTDVLGVDRAASHLGKWIARPLLRVRYRDGAGEDTVAWFVHDLDAWLRALPSAAVDGAAAPAP